MDQVESRTQVAREEMAASRYRQYRGVAAIAVRTIAIAVPLFSLLYLSNIFSRLRVQFFGIEYNTWFLLGVLVLLFLVVPAGKGAPRNKLLWYDVLLILGSVAGTGYVLIDVERILTHGAWATPLEVVLGLIMLAVLCEAVRRTIGLPLTIVVLIFFFYIKYAYLLPGILGSPQYEWSRLMGYVYGSLQGIFSNILEIAATLIILFVTFGALLAKSGAGKFFVDLAFSLLGSVRGGPAKVAVAASALFGTISGSAVANAGVTGSLTIPMMRRLGYKPHFAGAVEAVASTGGILMPPVMGAVAFLVADFVGVSYLRVCLAAAIPAILYYLSLFLQVDFEAAKLGLSGLPRKELPSFTKTLKEGWHFFIPLVVLLVFMMVLKYSVTTSCLYAMVTIIPVSWVRKETRMGLKKIGDALRDATYSVFLVVPVCALAGVITAGVAVTGLGVRLSAILVEIAAGNILVLGILGAIACYILGLGVASMPSYILVAIMVAPALVQAGVPLLAAHFFVFYMAMSAFITPPDAPAAYVAAGIAGANPLRTGFQAMRLGVVCYIVPFVSLYNPALLMIGSPVGIAVAAVTAAIGVIGLAAGFEGYLMKKLNWLERIVFLVGGITILVPTLTTNIIGAGILLVAVLWHWMRARGSIGKRLEISSGVLEYGNPSETESSGKTATPHEQS